MSDPHPDVSDAGPGSSRAAPERVYRTLRALEGGVLPRLFRLDFAGRDRIPPSGGGIVAANHLSYADPLLLDHYLLSAGRFPRFLAKAPLFDLPVIGWLGRSTGQIPVFRNSEHAGDALVAAAAALERGVLVVMYPEGTVTRDPHLWPMTGRLGAARLARRAGVPVIPVGQWGAHEVMPPPRPGAPRLLPRKTIHIRAGDPLDVASLDEHEGTRAIMDAVTALVAELRHETPPPGRWDMRVGERVAPA